MSGLYHRQVAQTRNVPSVEKRVRLELTLRQLEHLKQLLEWDVEEQRAAVENGALPFRCLRSQAILDKCQEM